MRTNVVALLHRALVAAEPEPDGEAAAAATEDASFALADLIPASIILGAAIAVAIAARFGVERAFRSRNEIIARLAARFLAMIVVAIGLFYALANLGIRVGPLLGALGIGGFAIAFAMKDTIENFISGVILQLRQPFGYRDTVKIGDYAGSVTDIDLRAVTMTLFSGEQVIIPSSDVLQNPIENWTANPDRRIDIDVGVDYDSDIEDTCALVADALRHVEGALDTPEPDCVFGGFGASSIDLVARVWYRSDGPYFDVQRSAASAVKRALDDAGIDIPYPVRTVLSDAPSAPSSLSGVGSPEGSAGAESNVDGDRDEGGDGEEAGVAE